nr:MAG TPA: hypothetical protein [Microviridae sp.]
MVWVTSLFFYDNILQDYEPIAAFERYTPAARVGPGRKTERSDFLIGAPPLRYFST